MSGRAMQMEFKSEIFDDGARLIHYKILGDSTRPLILCLHGFPEYWGAWRDLMPLLAERFCVVAPDQRGFGRSFKPPGISAYQTRNLVGDIAALADHLSPDKPFVLFGHDWGSAVAYAFSFWMPQRLKALVVANGVHPFAFQKAIIDDPQQRAASQYMTVLRGEDAAERMSKDNYARTLNMIAGFSMTNWMDEEAKAGYLDAWSAPGAMEAMLNWYRASPVVVPPVEQPAAELNGKVPVFDVDSKVMAVKMPHLIIWGNQDEALRPVCLEAIDQFAEDLTVKRVDGSGHWILHEQPQVVASTLMEWLDARNLDT